MALVTELPIAIGFPLPKVLMVTDGTELVVNPFAIAPGDTQLETLPVKANPDREPE